MTARDIIRAKQVVEDFLRYNGMENIYLSIEDSPSLSNVEPDVTFDSSNPFYSWGIYVNWSVKDISIHGPSSADWRNALTKKPQKRNIFSSVNNTFNPSPNGVWIGPFRSITDAYTFADLLRRVLYLQTHEDSKIFASRGITHLPERIF